MDSVPDRAELVLVFCWAVKVTVPLPVPLAPEVICNQGDSETAVHVQLVLDG